MKYFVTKVHFAFDEEWISKDERIEVTQDALGIWEVDDEDELVDKISDQTGWCIRSIDYTENLIHPLTSYK